jgi:hypothetical protein
LRRDGKQVAREVSGATYCQGRIWVVDNEDDQNLLVMEKNGSFSAHSLPSDGRISDLEGITSDRESLYLIAGGGLSKGGRVRPERFAMARVTLHQGDPTKVRIVDMLKWLVPFAQELGMEMEKAEGPDGEKIKVPEDGKFEGLAMMPDGRLLMGIRKPLVEESSSDSSTRWLQGSLRSREGLPDSAETRRGAGPSRRRDLVSRI